MIVARETHAGVSTAPARDIHYPTYDDSVRSKLFLSQEQNKFRRGGYKLQGGPLV